MAFEGHQNMFASSLFHQYQHQQASNSSGSTGSVASSFGSIHSASKNQDAASFVPWSHDDPRKLPDAADWDGETDLLGLVSNIVDEADSPDSYFNDGILPTCSSIWSPKTFKEGLQQCFQSEPKPQQNHSFFSNCKSHDSFRESQLQSASKDVEGSSHVPNGPATNQSWLLNFPNGDNHPVRTQRPPPGLQIPNAGSSYRPHVQQSKYDRSYGHHVSNVPDLSDIFQPQAELNCSYFDPFYEDHCSQSSMKPTHNEQYAPEAVTQLVNSFQALMPAGENAGCLGGFSNKQKETAAMDQEDGMADQWKTTGSASSKQNASGFHVPRKFLGDFQPVLRENNGGASQAAVKRDAFQDVPDFMSDTAEFFQPPKSSFAPVNFPSPYQKAMQKENTNDYLKQYFHLRQMQNNMKLQMQKGKMKTQTSGFQDGGLRGRSQNSTSMRAGEKQSHSQGPYLDFQGNVQFQSFEGENGMFSASTTPQFAPAAYTATDPRRRPSVPFSTALRYPLHYGNGFSGVNVGDMMPAHEAAATAYFARRGENVYQAPGATNTMLMNQGRSSIQFLICVDECYEQWRCLEKERKMTETFLMKNLLGKKTAAASNSSPSKPAANSSIIDQLIVNQMSEQDKVSGLLDTIECLHRVSLHVSIHTAVSRHQKAICALQASFKEDIAIMSKQQRACFTESKDAVVMMDVALKELAAATRKLRTALWCALQMTVPKPVKTQEHHVNKEAACRERCASPRGGYDFII